MSDGLKAWLDGDEMVPSDVAPSPAAQGVAAAVARPVLSPPPCVAERHEWELIYRCTRCGYIVKQDR